MSSQLDRIETILMLILKSKDKELYREYLREQDARREWERKVERHARRSDD
jgi:hypothetical protein